MNILLINHYAGNPELGMEFRPYYMAQEWQKLGHQVFIIGASFSHLRKKQPNRGFEVVNGIKYYWIPVNRYEGNGIGRIRSMFIFVSELYFYYKCYLHDFKPDIVIASSTYPLDIYPAYNIAKKYNARLVFEIHDLWPLSPMEIGGYSKYHPFIMMMQAAENFAYQHCDKCISILPCVQEHVAMHGLKLEKLGIVPNGFFEGEWKQKIELDEPYKFFFYQIKSEKKKILGYIGGHAMSNALDLLIDAMSLIKDQSIVAVLVGKGSEKERLKKLVVEKKLANVFFVDPIAKNMIPALLSEMDVLYLGGRNNSLYRFGTSQTKLFDYFQAGKPIIQTISPPNNYVEDSKSGITIENNSPQSIALGIETIMSYSQNERKEMGLRGKQYCNENFNYRKLAQNFIKYIE